MIESYKSCVKLIWTLTTIMCITVLVGIANAPASCPTGMISYWHLNDGSGTVASDYRSAYNGALKPSGSEPTWVSVGKVKGALSFDGVDDYVDCGDIIELNSKSAFTFLGWFKDDNIGGHNRHFDKGDGWDHDISGATYSNRLYIEVGNGANTYAYWTGYSSTISSGVWYHAAFVFDGSGTTNADRAKIYVNGVERSLTFSGSMPSATADLTGYPFTISKAVNPWDGDIDEIAFFDRALSLSEILIYYNNGLAGLGCCICPDIDSDGYDTCDPSDPNDYDGLPADCDDTDPTVFPGAPELPDGKDNDCDGQIDEGCLPSPPAVGGSWVRINKFSLLAPWIGLASLLTVVAASIVYVKHRKKKQMSTLTC